MVPKILGWSLGVSSQFQKQSKDKVEDFFIKLKGGKATGVDGIPASILKICAKELLRPLTNLFNLLFSLGEVPLICQKANITSVLKANGKENVENRRFIFLL